MVDPRTDPQFQKLAELRRSAVHYYKENQVPQLMETALNEMFFHQPQDVYAYLVEFFQQHAKPTTIDKACFNLLYCPTVFNFMDSFFKKRSGSLKYIKEA